MLKNGIDVGRLSVLGCFGHLGQLLRIWQKVAYYAKILHILARIWPFQGTKMILSDYTT